MVSQAIVGGHLLTMSGEGVGFVEDGVVVIEGRHIVAVGERGAVPGVDIVDEIIDARGCIVMPGLIDAHLHSAATTGRGWAQEVATWMASAYGPLMRHVIEADAHLWTKLALVEGVSNGTTCFGDYEFPMTDLLRSHEEVGSRAVVCEGVTELNWNNRELWLAAGWKPGDPIPLDRAMGEETLRRELELFDTWHGRDEGRLRVIFGPHAADFLSTEMLLQVQAETRKRGARLHLHVAQDDRENRATLERYGVRAIPYLDRIGLLAPDLIAVHLSTATPDEVRLVAERGATMICCANSIGIIDGVMPPAALFAESGGIFALGSDQSAGNNSHNMFSEMRATAMFSKIVAGSPLPMPAWPVLRAATMGGATALGIADVVGSLEVGKEADIILVDATRPPMAPVLLRPARNIVPNLVYAETGRNVRMTMVAGKVIYRGGEFARFDERAFAQDVEVASARFQDLVAQDAGVTSLPIVELSRSGKH